MIDPRQLAMVLCSRFDEDELALLREDPVVAIPLIDPEVSIDVVPHDPGEGCSVEGFYYEPQRAIAVRAALSPRRTRFTALHEFGHDRARHDLEVARALAGIRGSSSRRAEERIADAFAAAVLIPDAAVDQVLAGSSPTAQHLVALFNRRDVTGSREACCVRIAQRMTGEGYILLVEGEVLRYCAPIGSAYALARGSSQAGVGLLRRAAQDGVATDPQVSLLFAEGRPTKPYAGQAVTDDIYTFAVLTDATRPAWGGPWRVPQKWDGDAPEIFCADCDDVSEAWEWCPSGQRHRVCSNCGWCECRSAKVKLPTKMCDTCQLFVRVDWFADGSPTCKDCV